MRVNIISAGLILAAASLSFAQKKPLTHDVYDSWKSIGLMQLSPNGQWLAYTITPQEGDSVAHVKSTSGSTTYKFDRGTNIRFTSDSKFLVATIVPTRAENKEADAKKLKPEDRPKNKLYIINLQSGESKTLDRITSYTGSTLMGNTIIIRPEPPKKEEPPKEPNPPLDLLDQAAPAAAAPAQKAEEKKPEEKKVAGHGDGSTIHLLDLNTGTETKLENFGTSAFNEKGTALYFAKTPKELTGHGVFHMDIATKKVTPILEGLGQYTRIALNEEETALAIVTDKDDYRAKNPGLSIYTAKADGTGVKRVAFQGDKGIPTGWYIPKSTQIRWSNDGSRIQFGTLPIPPAEEKKDETPAAEKAELDIWSWTDVQLQPEQLLQVGRERARTYATIVDLKTGAINQVQTLEFKDLILPSDLSGDFAIQADEEFSGAGVPPSKVTLVNFKTGAKKVIADHIYGSVTWSPNGRWLQIYDLKTKNLMVLDPKNGRTTNVTERIPTSIVDRLADTPLGTTLYGAAGFDKDESTAYIYDEFDIWAVNLTNNDPAVNVTGGWGRSNGIVVRHISIDPESEYIDADKTHYFTLFNAQNKRAGFATGSLNKKQAPQLLTLDPVAYRGFQKARDAEVYTIQRETVSDYREVYLTDAKLSTFKVMSETNPQQKDYIWPTVELVEWVSLDGEVLQGKLYKPENFDLSKNYPMITYFYDRESDALHTHLAPAPSASTINIPYFVSNGYFVFVPDIPYKEGYPGESAVSAIVSGVNHVIGLGNVDRKKIGIQGQSWGGYQVAYLITETNMFAAAGAGAPVSNMFSAYGGIRYGTGLTRQLQYEQGQSRIGGTMWEYPLRFLENSPIFYADKVKTPLLIMHNDQDGAVPYTQGIEYFTALWRLKKPVWMLVYNNEDHNLIQRKNRMDLSIRLGQFFDHYLKGEPMPTWMSEGIPAHKKGTTFGFETPPKSGGSLP
jgi:dipeptidyl aminopeptidase/acylaminoacyl peptidase